MDYITNPVSDCMWLLQYFRDHELKAMWEWLTATGTSLLPIGIKGPLPGKNVAVELDWSTGEGAAEWHHQSAAFVIAQQHPLSNAQN